ncbi:kinase-like protein [Trametopsis cervina]|nr:kinase-like protein [Trametopsis cervina]
MYNDSLSLDSRKGMMEATKRGSPHNPQAQLRIQIIREVFKCAIILDNVMHTYSTLTYDYLITRRDMRTEIPERQRELFALRVRVLALFANSWWIPESLLDRPSMIRLLLRPIGEGEESGLLHELRPYTTAIVSARGYEADEVQTLILEINKLSPCSQKDHYRRLLTRLAQRADRLQVRTLMLKNVKKGEWLGAGAFADVYKGEWERSAVVIKAVKELKEKPSEDNVRGKICLEIITWATVKHPYLLALRGISDVEGVGALCMISPFMAGKTATERCSPPPEGLTHGHRRRLIKEIAEGMTYLHAEGIIHGDLRGPNIFITEAGHAQIADFGLAVYASGVSQNYLSMRIGNARWIAPELMDQTLRQQQKGDTAVFGRPTMQSDMYSFACTCTEILDGLIPYHNLLGETAVIHFVTTKQADGKYGRPGRPAHLQGRDGLRAEEEDEVLWGVIQRCWDPEQRPTFAEVAVMLSTLFLLS